VYPLLLSFTLPSPAVQRLLTRFVGILGGLDDPTASPCPWEEFASFSGKEQVSDLYGRPAIHPCCPDLRGVLGVYDLGRGDLVGLASVCP
jgi:hypothetical protein